MHSLWIRTFILVLGLLLAGCQTYAPEPLDPQQIFERTERARHLLEEDARDGGAGGPGRTIDEALDESLELFTLRRAAALMSLHSPALREVVAEYETAAARAGIKTPWPNPSIEAGPKVGSNMDGDTSRRVQPFVSLGFTIPLSGRLGQEDRVSQRTADLAFIKVLTRHRKLYLELRAAYTEWILARAGLETSRHITTSLDTVLTMTRQLVDAGVAGALDVGQMELELQQSRIELITAERAIADAEAALSALIGVHPSSFGPAPDRALPELPDAAPDISALQSTMLGNQLDLAVLRGEYELKESALALEIIKQYPDLDFGAEFEKEPGETLRVLTFGLGMELPLFDRNQQGIAEALKARQEIYEKYSAAMNLALGDLEHSFRLFELSLRKMRSIMDQALPRAQANVELAKRSMTASQIDSLQFLQVERDLRTTIAQAIASELEFRKTMIAMESAVGCPLWYFPSEMEWMIPPLPGNLDQPTISGEDSVELYTDNMESS
ncbi:MAG: TolC family protein [Planctomycetota bacterium]|jgi:outer membrane protein TolC